MAPQFPSVDLRKSKKVLTPKILYVSRGVVMGILQVTPKRTSPAIGLFLALVPGSIFLWMFLSRSQSIIGSERFTLFDDAMISMAYGRTFAETGEWVWFPGSARIQGVTNPLWTAYMAFLHLMGLEGSSAALAVSLTSAALILASAVLVYLIVHTAIKTNSPIRQIISLTAAGTVPFLFPLAFWSMRGMEVGLLSFLILLMVVGFTMVLRSWSSQRPPVKPLWLMALAGILGVTTRLDFLIFVIIVALLGMLWSPDVPARRRFILGFALPVLVAVLIILGVQYLYFGDALPNTYQLKVDGFSLADRIERGVASSGKVAPITVLVALSMIPSFRRMESHISRTSITLATIWFGCLAYSIWVGGDAWEWTQMGNRYLSVGMAAATAGIFLGISQLMQNPPRERRLLTLGLVVFVAAGIGYGVTTNPITFDPEGVASQVLVLLASSFMAILSFSTYWRRPNSVFALLALALSTSLLIFSAVSALPMWHWWKHGVIHSFHDSEITMFSMEVRDSTSLEAVVATVWAGSPGYYMERNMVDILGKNDSVIAASRPAEVPPDSPVATLFPGHNKWNYEYSIGELRPDVVFQLWNPTNEDFQQLSNWGYKQFCFSDGKTPVYFLLGSPNVDWSRLNNCSP